MIFAEKVLSMGEDKLKEMIKIYEAVKARSSPGSRSSDEDAWVSDAYDPEAHPEAYPEHHHDFIAKHQQESTYNSEGTLMYIYSCKVCNYVACFDNDEKSAGAFYAHAVQTGAGGHIQWGQVMPQVMH